MQGGISGDKTGQPVARNIRLTIAYDGTGYFGWQSQSGKPTIQGLVREAIRKISGEDVNLIGSGRTDAGTHARGLVANFKTTARVPPAAWIPALNRQLPPDIRVLSSRVAPPEFHARKSARSKVYRYQIYRGQVIPPHRVREHFHYPYPLDFALMQRAARLFEGKHDFASFAAHSGVKADPNEETSGARTVRRMLCCRLTAVGKRLVFEVEGTGFLHHMVRNMVGTLLEVGRGRMTLGKFRELFRARDRTLAGFTAPARGLILMRVRY